jgi:hypothetical protein
LFNIAISIDQKVLARYSEKADQLLQIEAQKAVDDLLVKGAMSAIKAPVRATGIVI